MQKWRFCAILSAFLRARFPLLVRADYHSAVLARFTEEKAGQIQVSLQRSFWQAKFRGEGLERMAAADGPTK